MTNDLNRLIGQLKSMQTGLSPHLLNGVGEENLRIIDMATLSALADGRELTIKALATTIGRSMSHTSRIVDRLVKQEYLVRREHPADRRAKCVRLGPEGEVLMTRVHRHRAIQIDGMLAQLTPAQRRLVDEAFELLGTAAGRYRNARIHTES